jgi:hypothetical protein
LCLGLLAGTLTAQEQGTDQEPGTTREQGTAAPPGREVSLPASEVKDTFFAYFLGIIQNGVDIEIDNEEMRAILVEFKSTIAVPFDLISRVTQHADPDTGERSVALVFQHDVVIPIPFSILFYHPGRITSTRLLSFDVRRSSWSDPGSSAEPGEALDLVLAQGSLLVEIDGWLKALFSAYLEDTLIQHIVFFRWHGDWTGMLEGTGQSTARAMRAYFDFRKNSIIFPVPDPLNRAGRFLVPDAPAQP